MKRGLLNPLFYFAKDFPKIFFALASPPHVGTYPCMHSRIHTHMRAHTKNRIGIHQSYPYFRKDFQKNYSSQASCMCHVHVMQAHDEISEIAKYPLFEPKTKKNSPVMHTYTDIRTHIRTHTRRCRCMPTHMYAHTLALAPMLAHDVFYETSFIKN